MDRRTRPVVRGQALPEELCVYEKGTGSAVLVTIYNPAYLGGSDNVSRTGFGIYFTPTAYTEWSYGSWTLAAS